METGVVFIQFLDKFFRCNLVAHQFLAGGAVGIKEGGGGPVGIVTYAVYFIHMTPGINQVGKERAFFHRRGVNRRYRHGSGVYQQASHFLGHDHIDIFGSQIGMTAAQISLFVAMLFAGALVLQYPIGWLSDRMDRRKLIFGAAVLGMLFCTVGWITAGAFWFLMVSAFFAGGVTTPLYALFLAYTNDTLPSEDMPAASGGLVFTFGLGAIAGPLVTGWAMEMLGPFAFWLVLGVTFCAIALYALYRMTQRASTPSDETESYLGVLPTTSPVAVEAAATWSADMAEADRQPEVAGS